MTGSKFYYLCIMVKKTVKKSGWATKKFKKWMNGCRILPKSHPTAISTRFLKKEKHWLLSLKSEKAMAPHSSTLAWKIPWTEEPGRLQSMGSLRVWHDWATSLSLFTFMYWRRKWQPTPVFLPGESQGQGSLASCRLWSCIQSDTT